MTDRVEMRLRGRMPERFIGKALENGVTLDAVQRDGPGEMILAVSSREARVLLALAEEYGVDLTVLREAGWPLWRKRLMERSTLALGILLGVLMIWLFTSRVWLVEARSLDGAADADTLRGVVQTAREMGARPGMLRSSVDRDALAMDIQARWPQMTHVSVRVRGVRLQVEVAMEESAPEIYDLEGSRDLVALRDAVILRVNALSGKAAVQAGDTVKRGQVLIRGEERIDREVTRGVRALGEVLARVWFTGSCELPLQETVRVRTGQCRVSAALKLLNWQWPLAEAEGFSCQEVETQVLPVGGLYLPMRIERTIFWEAKENIISRDVGALKVQGEAWALELARAEKPDGAEETDFWIDYEEKDGVLTVRATIEAQMDIAGERARLADSFE